MDVIQRLKDLGHTLADAPAPAANYIPWTILNNQIIVSGQISKDGDELLTGRLGDNVSITEGQSRARICALNLLSQVNAAIVGDWSRFVRVVRLGGFVNASADFTDHPAVINGASDFMVEVFGDDGRHARAAVGCSSLPLGVSVEIEGIFEIRPA